MLYYAQHTRPITELAGIKGPSKLAARQPLAAARAVNELQVADLRLASAAASEHNDCLAAADDLQRINDKSATMVHCDDGKPILQPKMPKLYDNLLKRSIRNYHIVWSRLQKVAQDSTLPRVMRQDCATRERGFCQRGIPFHVYIPL